ncbi:uncharacterized protein LOC128226696 [Mya arenaria]|uniref:uncharacterized protein LOC128226696 n=1 Tax=Mya arenaria TaxID=6604 RepID=UPI0022E2C26C|nr:uncharacterized protein LOC128226696 [Mya arenaria]
MEVPGKKLRAGPNDENATYCQPCEQDDEILPAEAYCTVCKEFFCSNCASVHRKQKMSRSHTLLDKSNMPTSISSQEVTYECTVSCEIHPEESIKYFCSTHQTLICGHCSVQNHRSCHADVISDIYKAFKDDQEYGDIIETIARLFEDIDLCASDVKKNVDVVAKLAENEVEKLRRYREEVYKYFEEREQVLLKFIEKTKILDEELLGSLKLKYKSLRSKLEEINVTLEAQGNNMIQLFIKTKRAKKQLEGLQIELAHINKENVIHHYEFRKYPATERLIASDTGIGTLANTMIEKPTALADSNHGILGLTVQGDVPRNTMATVEPTVGNATVDLTILRFTPALDMTMKSPTDNRDCYLSSMLHLAGSRLIMADWHNCTVKLVDLQTNNLLSQISVPGHPWDMCHLPGDRWYVKVGLLSSDMSRNTITKLDMNLNIIKTFQDPALKRPTSITAFGDHLLICCNGSNTNMILDLSTGQMTQLMGKKEGIRNPLCAFYCPQQNKLLVTEEGNNVLKVYNTIE